MAPGRRSIDRDVLGLIGIIGWASATSSVWAQGATRDLSEYTAFEVTFTVTIVLDPGDAQLAGVEEAPPVGWTVSNISDSGTWDMETEKVKWGPFFGSIPPEVTYDVTPLGEGMGEHCFAGTVTFDTLNDTIGGDECIMLAVPTLSEWGTAAMVLLVLTAGTVVFGRRGPA